MEFTDFGPEIIRSDRQRGLFDFWISQRAHDLRPLPRLFGVQGHDCTGKPRPAAILNRSFTVNRGNCGSGAQGHVDRHHLHERRFVQNRWLARLVEMWMRAW